ncbi:MAG TPA: 4'-phosphopantetheinyl transferase superfamily protein [Luteolibacter sp.]|nr:4'-phosphopantetheinyl transferase superfamily protein [Luteolibacter sp.]
MIRPAASLHIIVPDQIADPEGDLTRDELHRASAFRFAGDRERWIACRSALRRILGEICQVAPRDVPIIIGPNGKPLLAPPFEGVHFNLSHCEDLALIAVDSAPVGVDLEPLSRAPSLIGCEASFCHPDEISALPSDESARGLGLLSIWTAKEAALKAIGTGLLHPPGEIFVDLHTGIVRSDRSIPGIEKVGLEKLTDPRLAHHSAFLARCGN